MGLEMIEQSEMSALAPSRLGDKCFINDDDEDNFSNFSLRGKKYHDRKRAQNEGSTVPSTWVIDPTKENDCAYLQQRLLELQNAIEVQLSSAPSKARIENVVGAMKNAEANYKNKIATLKCLEKQASSDLQKQKEDTLAEINKASASTPDLTQPLPKGSKTTKYLMYGIGGIVAIVTLVIVFKALKK
jgi:F0F1-type ATP synthase beta subunit